MQAQGIKEIEDIQEFIQILKEHQKKCEAEEKFVEAEMAKNRLREIIAKETIRYNENLRSRQLSQRMEVEDNHLKMQEYQQNAEAMEQAMDEKHAQYLNKFREDQVKSMPPNFKPSGDLLNLRKIYQTLAKRKEYAEAHKIQQKCQEMEVQEQKKYENQKLIQLQIKEQQLICKQKIELNALHMKIQEGMDEQKKQRTLELDRLLQRYQNVKKELENEQILERLKVSKTPLLTTKSTANTSRRPMSRQAN